MTGGEPTFTARMALGQAVEGWAAVASDGFSARYDLDRLRGIFVRPGHALAGRSYVDLVLVLDSAKGGVATAWMLHEMAARGMAPRALVLNHVNPIMAQGCALAGIPLLAGFAADITTAIPDGAVLRVDPDRREVRVIKGGWSHASGNSSS